MSVDKLQDRIRKLKNPSVIELNITKEQIPQFLMEQEGSFIAACGKFCRETLYALKEIVPAVRFSYGYYAIFGTEGVTLLHELLDVAKHCGYYVLLDTFELLSASAATQAAGMAFALPADGYIVTLYSGADAIKPYVDLLQKTGKSVFVNIRTPNKSASQIQDLMTGTRLVYMAAADVVNRSGENLIGRSGYSLVAGVVAANSVDSLKSVRNKHKKMFLMVDGYDYSNANAKNCSLAFDQLGHGAIVCAGSGVVAAWLDEEVDCRNYVESTVRAATRMKKNITRYVTIL